MNKYIRICIHVNYGQKQNKYKSCRNKFVYLLMVLTKIHRLNRMNGGKNYNL